MLLPYTSLVYFGPGCGAVVDVSSGSVEATVKGFGRAEGATTGWGIVSGAHVTGLKNRPMTTTGVGQISTAYPRGKGRPTMLVSIGARPSAEDIAQAVWGMDNGIETGWTPRQVMRVLAAILAGKVSGAGGNAPVFRAITDAKDRVSATSDTAGNRLSVSIDSE